ncbi:MAG: hypothetical protein ACI825_000526 [Planctomycetota bacterium]|jgi:hypothetical protein
MKNIKFTVFHFFPLKLIRREFVVRKRVREDQSGIKIIND